MTRNKRFLLIPVIFIKFSKIRKDINTLEDIKFIIYPSSIQEIKNLHPYKGIKNNCKMSGRTIFLNITRIIIIKIFFVKLTSSIYLN